MDVGHVAAAGGSCVVMDLTGRVKSTSGSWTADSLVLVPHLARNVLMEAGLLASTFREAGRRLERITVQGGKDVLIVAIDATSIYVVKRVDTASAGSFEVGSGGGGSLLGDSSDSSGSS